MIWLLVALGAVLLAAVLAAATHHWTGTDRLRVRIVPHDVWVGIHVTHWYVYVCPVPFLCFRLARRRAGDPGADREEPEMTRASSTHLRSMRSARGWREAHESRSSH